MSPSPHLHLPHFHHPHLRSTGWRIADDDERTVSGAYVVEVAAGLVTLKLASVSGGAEYALHGYTVEIGVGIGLKEKFLKGAVKDFVEGLEKTEHYSISSGLPGGTIGPLFHRSGRFAPVTAGMFNHSNWVVVGFDGTGIAVNGSVGLICLLDPIGAKPPSVLHSLLPSLGGIGTGIELYERTVAWGLLAGLAAAPGFGLSASGRGIHVTSVDQSNKT